ncbi:inhibitor of KinA sporulation pathway (predicted exonuclease) [Stackebrandtia albiflava]|uniref:Inhibitor of KinA sporulation pathway (Predicted exonuclease) n=1 Tax=Stackebrandtia albiflava TaxID=406432 RepID=A0A562V4Y7_9ACTN|nr:3'-5' exonuclease [Stackebrandtia albiflava]TWJ12915.1 inhibitor of KinA sporulation pathway (predicted exonuclease) [Stackebrandtia albiflava]
MSTESLLLNVIDVEATCWRGSPPPGQTNEIIEIGLCVVDLTEPRRVGRHRIMVRPARSTVSAFCTELTGHTPADVAEGVDFAEACRLLREEYDGNTRPWASWGDYDREQFRRQCRATGVGYPLSPAHTNAKAVFTDANGLRKRPGMAKALTLAGLPLEGRHHNGADDAWNIGALILTFAEPGRRLPVTTAAPHGGRGSGPGRRQ